MELKESFHKWANSGKTLVAYGPREEGGYSLHEYDGGRPKELFRSESLEEIQAAFRNYYAVKAQFEKGMPWKVAGNHLVICREAPDGKFEVREYNSFKNRIQVPLTLVPEPAGPLSSGMARSGKRWSKGGNASR